MLSILIGTLVGVLIMLGFAAYARSCVKGLRDMQRRNAAIDEGVKKGKYGPGNPQPFKMQLSELPNTMRGMIVFLSVSGGVAAGFGCLFGYMFYLLVRIG